MHVEPFTVDYNKTFFGFEDDVKFHHWFFWFTSQFHDYGFLPIWQWLQTKEYIAWFAAFLSLDVECRHFSHAVNITGLPSFNACTFNVANEPQNRLKSMIVFKSEVRCR